MRRHGRTEEIQLAAETMGLLGGLVQDMQQDMVTSLQPGHMPISGKNAEQACECAFSTAHCYRSSSQRSLGTPFTIMGDNLAMGPGSSLFGLLTAGLNLGVNPVVIYNADNNRDRERIEDLVLVGLWVWTNIIVDSPDGNTGSLSARIAEFVNAFLTLRVQYTSDTRDLWVSDTLVSYFDRGQGGPWRGKRAFVPLPPVRWEGRDAKIEIDVRPADFVASGAVVDFPVLTVPQGLSNVHAEIQVDGLWITDPRLCGQYWPGELCPPELISVSGIKGGPSALQKIMERARAALSRDKKEKKQLADGYVY